jgi:hypothetical protein
MSHRACRDERHVVVEAQRSDADTAAGVTIDADF